MSFNVESYFSGLSDGNQILYYKGNIDSDLITRVLDMVEEKLISFNESPKLRKRVYNVLVESLQNLYHHAGAVPAGFEDQTSERFGILSINKIHDGYRIVTGNFIGAEETDELEKRLARINNSSNEEIIELYKHILNHQCISVKGGGGLGLVDIARKTGNKLGYVFNSYDADTYFFCLDILVNNNK